MRMSEADSRVAGGNGVRGGGGLMLCPEPATEGRWQQDTQNCRYHKQNIRMRVHLTVRYPHDAAYTLQFIQLLTGYLTPYRVRDEEGILAPPS